MADVDATDSKTDLRAVIKFLTQERCMLVDIHPRILACTVTRVCQSL